MTMTIEEISAHLEIRQVLARYCRGVDRRDLAMLRSVYHPDGTDDHSMFTGLGHDFAQFVLDSNLAAGRYSQHQVTTSLITLHDADSADVESYYLAFTPMIHEPGEEPSLLFTGGRYIDRFERREGQWKIARRVCTIDWSRRHLDGPEWEGAAIFPVIGDRETDPSATQFDFRGSPASTAPACPA